jgi:hypothetical protein
MLGKIITQLKTGTIKRVVPYGVSRRPSPPYVVVRPERDPLGRGRVFRVIAHFQPDQQAALEDYVFGETITLLDNFTAQSRHNNDNQVLTEQDYLDIIVNNDDGTISMERRFLMPSRTF